MPPFIILNVHDPLRNGNNTKNNTLNEINGTINLFTFFTNILLNESPYVEKNSPEMNINKGILTYESIKHKGSGTEM